MAIIQLVGSCKQLLVTHFSIIFTGNKDNSSHSNKEMDTDIQMYVLAGPPYNPGVVVI